jgi:microcystin degradation protein MlrC
MGTRMLVYADTQDKAQILARQLADELVAMREQLIMSFPDIDASLDEALAFKGGPVVIADSADNPGGGAPGDSTWFLRRMIERGISNVALGPLWDPVAARIAFEAGVGAQLAIRIGGKIGPLSGDPLDLQCTVKALQTDMRQTGLAGTPAPMGDCALVEAAGIEIVLATMRTQAMGTDLFTQLGCDLSAKKIILVKSSQHFYASFMQVAQHVIYGGAPGVVALDWKKLPYTRIQRPKWPIDGAVP